LRASQIMTYLVSGAHSDTPGCYALAWFRRQPAPDFPGGGFTIDVIGVCPSLPWTGLLKGDLRVRRQDLGRRVHPPVIKCTSSPPPER
jgi:hypothetical protein